MLKENVLEYVKRAKQTHASQVSKVDYLIRGIPLSSTLDPAGKRECFFGTWLYSEEKNLRVLIHSHHYDEIERLHSQWHDEFTTIYKIFYPENQGFLSKMIGKKHNASMQARDRAKAYFTDLQKTTELMLRKIEVIEKRIIALPESKFTELEAS